MQMFRLDSQRHINILQAATELFEGVFFIEDRNTLVDTLKRHLILEKEALGNANRILNIGVNENQGFKLLLQICGDDEKRHHTALRILTVYQTAYKRLWSNVMRQKSLEERYQKSKEF